MNKINFRVKYFLILIPISIFFSCSQSIVENTDSIIENDNNTEIESSFSEIQSNIFNTSCAFGGCHSSGSINPDLSGNSFARIVDQPSSTGMNYITPNNPNESYLLQKILGGSIINGSRMPLNSSPLSDDEINAITDWINAGAKNN